MVRASSQGYGCWQADSSGDGRPAVRQRGGGTTGWGRCTHCRNLKRESRVAAEAARTNQLKPRIKGSGVRTTTGCGAGSRWAAAGAIRRTSSMTRTAGRTDDAWWLISITAVRKGKTLWYVAKEATGDQSATGQLPRRTRTPGPRRVGVGPHPSGQGRRAHGLKRRISQVNCQWGARGPDGAALAAGPRVRTLT